MAPSSTCPQCYRTAIAGGVVRIPGGLNWGRGLSLAFHPLGASWAPRAFGGGTVTV